MPSILVYALESDLQTIVDYLNKDPDIAYVIADGPRRWRTVDGTRSSLQGITSPHSRPARAAEKRRAG
jgi:hypothetical protein